MREIPITLHKYLYAYANPVTYEDPSGYFAVTADIMGTLYIMNTIDSNEAGAKLPLLKMAGTMAQDWGKSLLANQRLMDILLTVSVGVELWDLYDEVIRAAKGGSEGSEENVTEGKSQAPKEGEPGSTYRQVNNKGNTMSETKYGKNRKPEYRDDHTYYHYDKNTKQHLKPHRHHYKYNERGEPVKPTVPVTPIK